MAIENAKTLNVRIKNKYDSYENWAASGLVLEAGEIAIAYTTVDVEVGNGTAKHPALLMKVGDGEKTFANLPWLSAKAADVLSVCKDEADLTEFVNTVIGNAGIATDEAMQALSGKVTTAEGKITALEGKMTTAEGKITANEAAIVVLNGLVGDKKVSTQIEEKISALNLATTYETKGEAAKVSTALETYKTSNDAAVKKVSDDLAGEISRAKAAEKVNTDAIAAIKDGTTIDSFADVETALAGKEASGAAAQALADAKTYADGLAGNYDAAGSAATAESNAKAYAKEYADGLAENYDAAGSAAQALTDAKAYTDGFTGGKTVSAAITEAITGANLGQYETKTDAAAKLTEAKSHTNTEVAKVQGEVDALETLVGTLPEGTTAKDVVDYVNVKTAGIATEGAMTELAGRVTQAEKDIDAIEADYLKAADKTALEGKITAEETRAKGIEEGLRTDVNAIKGDYLKAEDKTELAGGIADNTEAIEALQGLVGDSSVADRIKAEKERAEGVESGLATRIKAVEDDYLTSDDKEALQTQINTIMNNPDAEGAINSINEFTKYVEDHGEIAEGFRTDINANAAAIEAIEKDYLKATDKTELEGKITAEETRAKGVESGLDNRLKTVEAAVGESGSVADDIAGALAEAKGYTDTEVKELADGAVKTNAADIATLKGLVSDKKVSEQITDVTNPLANRIVELEKVDHSHANADELDKFVEGDKAKLDAAVQTVTAGTGLTATKTGTDVAIAFDDSVTFIFNCGGADVEA